MEEKNLESPKKVTLTNTTNEDIAFRYYNVNLTETIKPGDSLILTVNDSASLGYYEDVAIQEGMEYEAEEPTPPVPVVLDTETIDITESTQSISIDIEGIMQQLSTLSTEAFWDKLIPSEVSGNCVLFVELGTTDSKQIGFFMNSQDGTFCLGTNRDGDYSIELYEGSIDNITFGDAVSRIALLGPKTGDLPISILGENVTYYINGVKVNYYNNTDIVEESVLLALPENYITANETPSPTFNTKRVNTTNNSITIKVPDLVNVLGTLIDTEYWYKYIEELNEGDDIRPSFVLGKTANNEEFGLMYFATSDGGMKLWVGNETALIADTLYEGSTSAQISGAIGFMQEDAPDTFTIATDTLGSYVDYYTDGILLRYLPDEESSEVEEVKVPLTMPDNYIV